MSASRSGTRDTSMSIPTSPFDAISDELDDEARRAQVLQRREQLARRAARGSTRAASSPRTGRRSARSGASTSSSSELGAGEHRRAADPVAAGERAEQHERGCRRRPRRCGSAARCGAMPEAHRVDEAVLLVGRLEVDLAADRRHADRVAVVADARRPRGRAGSASARESSSPKRSESSTAIGRAPTAKTSRRMPPTPVAAPWNGSTALGWLCDSTLNATASPSPTSTAPAFSPGPISRCGPSVGSRRSSFFECL